MFALKEPFIRWICSAVQTLALHRWLVLPNFLVYHTGCSMVPRSYRVFLVRASSCIHLLRTRIPTREIVRTKEFQASHYWICRMAKRYYQYSFCSNNPKEGHKIVLINEISCNCTQKHQTKMHWSEWTKLRHLLQDDRDKWKTHNQKITNNGRPLDINQALSFSGEKGKKLI